MRNRVERFSRKDGTPGRYSSFICGTYIQRGKSACTIHTIYEHILAELVLSDIREKAQFAAYDRDHLLEKIIHMKNAQRQDLMASCESKLRAVSARIAELEQLMQSLYEDKCAGVIPQAVFQTLMQKYEAERAQKAAILPELERKVKEQTEGRQGADRWAEIIRRYTEITELDESILFELVDRIEIGEAKKHLGIRIQDVKVFYRYVGCVDDALAQTEQEAI